MWTSLKQTEAYKLLKKYSTEERWWSVMDAYNLWGARVHKDKLSNLIYLAKNKYPSSYHYYITNNVALRMDKSFSSLRLINEDEKDFCKPGFKCVEGLNEKDY